MRGRIPPRRQVHCPLTEPERLRTASGVRLKPQWLEDSCLCTVGFAKGAVPNQFAHIMRRQGLDSISPAFILELTLTQQGLLRCKY